MQQKAHKALRILYSIWIVTGMFGLMYVPSKVGSDIAGHELLFRAGMVSNLVTQLVFIFAALYLYVLFRKVSKKLGVLMVVLALVSVPIAMLTEVFSLAALHSTSNPNQMKLFLDMHSDGILVASIFWGLWLFPLGILVKNSGYFPKIIGWAVIAAGVGYVLGTFIDLLLVGYILPDQNMFSSFFEILTFGEVVFLGWLVLKGAKLPSK